MRILLLLSGLLFIGMASAQQPKASEIYGAVDYPSTPGMIKRGHGYNADGSKVMHSDDPMATPARNIILSFFPLSFSTGLPPTNDAFITQREQTFIPLVLPVTTGTTLYFLNEDEFFHNIYSLTPGSRFNIGRRPPGSPYPITIKKEGLIKLSCDIHPHMEGYILSLRTPYFTRVDENGRYRMPNLPAGRYRVEVFHPQLEKMVRTVEVSGQEKRELNFDYKNRKNR